MGDYTRDRIDWNLSEDLCKYLTEMIRETNRCMQVYMYEEAFTSLRQIFAIIHRAVENHHKTREKYAELYNIIEVEIPKQIAEYNYLTMLNRSDRPFMMRLGRKRLMIETSIYKVYHEITGSMNDIGLLFKIAKEDTRAAIFQTN